MTLGYPLEMEFHPKKNVNVKTNENIIFFDIGLDTHYTLITDYYSQFAAVRSEPNLIQMYLIVFVWIHRIGHSLMWYIIFMMVTFPHLIPILVFSMS